MPENYNDLIDSVFDMFDDDREQENRRETFGNVRYDSYACPNVRFGNIMDSISEYERSNIWD